MWLKLPGGSWQLRVLPWLCCFALWLLHNSRRHHLTSSTFSSMTSGTCTHLNIDSSQQCTRPAFLCVFVPWPFQAVHQMCCFRSHKLRAICSLALRVKHVSHRLYEARHSDPCARSVLRCCRQLCATWCNVHDAFPLDGSETTSAARWSPAPHTHGQPLTSLINRC